MRYLGGPIQTKELRRGFRPSFVGDTKRDQFEEEIDRFRLINDQENVQYIRIFRHETKRDLIRLLIGSEIAFNISCFGDFSVYLEDVSDRPERLCEYVEQKLHDWKFGEDYQDGDWNLRFALKQRANERKRKLLLLVATGIPTDVAKLIKEFYFIKLKMLSS